MIGVDRAAALPPELAQGIELAAARKDAAPIGTSVLYFPVATSTNDLAMRLAEQGYGDGTLVLAGQQTAGRGRGGHTWFSPPGTGLYGSVLLDAAAPGHADWVRTLTLAAGVALAEGLHAASGLPVSIKWPNDIVVSPAGAVRGARKLAGILAEATSEQGRVSRVVLGIGINVRATAWPPDISARVTSLEEELGRPVDAGLVLGTVLSRLGTWVRRLRAGQSAAMLARWHALAVGATAAPVEIAADGQVQRGVSAGLNTDGALLVRQGTSTVPVLSGEVRWL